MSQIIVVWNYQNSSPVILEKAAALSDPFHNTIHIVVFISPENTHQKEKLEPWLKEHAASYFPQETNLLFTVTEEKKTDWIPDYCSKNDVQLVIKPWDRDPSAWFTSADQTLIRTLECPVLIAGTEVWEGHSRVLATIDLGSHTDEQKALNRKVAMMANYWSAPESGELHLFYCIPLAVPLVELDIQEQEAIEQQRSIESQQELEQFAHSMNLNVDGIHVRAGHPRQEIPALARETGAQLIVIGNMARTGLSAILLGNTAEKILPEVKTDILIVR